MDVSDLDKKFYKISDVAEILGIPASTLRFWEKQFTIIKPRRNAKNIRFYTPQDIETIRKVYYLVKEKGLKLDAAQEQIRRNRANVDKRFEVIERLKGIRQELTDILDAMAKLQWRHEITFIGITIFPRGGCKFCGAQRITPHSGYA